jgi:succinate dehydrogenase/fumarate reductase flavoprotein subunit
MELNRRDFLKGALVAGAGVTAGAALVACDPGAAESPTAGSSASGGNGPAAANGIGKHTWEVKPDPITSIAETKDYDIVVVGAGVAGLCASEAAARNGASVAVLERTDSYQMRGMDNGNIGSKWHKANGFDIDPRTPAKLLHLWAKQTTNYNLIYTWASRSGEVFDYIESLLQANGMEFVHALSGTAKYGWDTLPERWRVYPDAVSFVRGDEIFDTRPDGKSVQWNLGDALYKSAAENGAEFIYNTHAEQLVGDAAGGVTGVIASDADGNYIQYNAAKGVILATGDICGNQEMIDAFAPICNRSDGNIYAPAGGNTGDAILMGSWIGAAISKSPAAPMVHQFTLDSYSFNLTAFIMCWLAVDKNGGRYGAEMPFEPYLNNARMNTPGNKAWSVFDADYKDYVQQQWPTKYEQWLSGIEEEMEKRIASGTLFKADTLDDLASQLGIPADNFKATVERYNSMTDLGEDLDFAVPTQFLSKVQTAPFYATPLVCSTLTIPFGLHVNDDSQVCTEDDVAIKGLYAVGNAQGDFFGGDYPVHCPGISHGRSITFGQLVGEAVAKDTVITKLEFS